MRPCGLFVAILFAGIHVLNGLANVTFSIGDCQGLKREFRDDKGWLRTFNYPGGYQSNCEWLVAIYTSTEQFYLTIDSLDIGVGDTFKISDPAGFSVTYSSESRTPSEFLILRSPTELHFKADEFGTGAGVLLSWSTTKPTVYSKLDGIVEIRNINPGVTTLVQSPSYPNEYPPNSIQHWILTAPENRKIMMLFKYLKMDSLGDSLQIYSGDDLITEEIIGRYSGNMISNLPPPLLSTTNWVHIKFISNGDLQYQGYSIQCYVYEPATTATPPTTTSVPNSLKPGDVAAIVVIIVLVVFLIAGLTIGYKCWYKPRKFNKEATVLYNRDGSASEEVSINGITDGVTLARPQTALARPSTAMLRPGTASQRPNTAKLPSAPPDDSETLVSQQLSTPAVRPGTASQRPGTASQRPGTASQRPGIASQRPGTASQRPGTASQRYDQFIVSSTKGHQDYRSSEHAKSILVSEEKTEGDLTPPMSKRPTASIVGTREKTVLDGALTGIRSTPQIFVNYGIDDEDSEAVVIAKQSQKKAKKLPPLGGVTPIVRGSALPPIQNNRGRSSDTLVPPLSLPSSARSDYDDEPSKW